MSDDSDKLIERWVAGDADAAAELYKRYFDRARAFGLALTNREVEAEELAQQALSVGLEVLRDGKRPEKFTGWLLGIVKKMNWKQRGKTGVLPSEFIVADPRVSRPSKVLMDREMNHLLGLALQALDDEERETLERRLIRRQTREEAARDMNCSKDTVDRRLDRAMERMREHLSAHFTTLVVSGPPPTREQVEALRPSFRQAFVLRHVEGLSIEEIAARLALPEVTIRERLQYAYLKLHCSAATDFKPLRAAF